MYSSSSNSWSLHTLSFSPSVHPPTLTADDEDHADPCHVAARSGDLRVKKSADSISNGLNFPLDLHSAILRVSRRRTFRLEPGPEVVGRGNDSSAAIVDATGAVHVRVIRSIAQQIKSK